MKNSQSVLAGFSTRVLFENINEASHKKFQIHYCFDIRNFLGCCQYTKCPQKEVYFKMKFP